LLWSLKSFSLYETPRPLGWNLSRLVAGVPSRSTAAYYRGKGIAFEVDGRTADTVALCASAALQHVLLFLHKHCTHAPMPSRALGTRRVSIRV